ncbi:MAG TPA: VCBS repeat-containing protein, partial [Verrucomicrobiales bacterium]|nr:VCBS repeat-containing protein [Verrucomicrobiales bacterium]
MIFLSSSRSLRLAAALLIPAASLPAFSAPLTLSPLPGSSPPADCVFRKLDPSQTGLKHKAMIEAENPLRRLYASAMSLGGIAGGDVNGDGRADLLFCGAAQSSRLYIQTGPLQFKDVTAEAGLDTKGKWDVGTAIVDVNGDGMPDIFVTRYDQPCALYINQGTGPNGVPKFKDEATARGVAVVDASHTPVFFDYDRDGSLDLYLMTNRYYRETEATASEMVDSTPDGKVSIRPEMAKYYSIYRTEPDPAGGRTLFEAGPAGRPDYLFHNDGSGKFTDVTEKAGISGASRGLSTTVWDYDNDGWPDLYVANDFEDYDCLYHNNHDGTFTDAIRTTVPLTSWFSMGADCADFDGDGLLDLFVADMSGTTHFKQKISMGSMSAKASFLGSSNPRQAMRNTLFLNTRSGRFREAAFLSHLDSSDWTWAVQAQDFDSDGRPDIYVTNGMTRNFNEPDDPRAVNPKPGQTLWDRHKDLPKLEEQNLAWRNDGDLHFTDVSKTWGLAEVSVSMAAASLDLDGDGRLDIVTVDADRAPGVYQNSGGGNRLTVALHQPGANASAIGARVTLTAGALTLVREIQLMHGYLGCQPAELHFGLGTAAQADSLRVRWPDGTEETFGPVPANQRCVVERSEKAQAPPLPPAVTALFKPSAGFPPMRMEEIPFDDFWVQPLLPNKNSQLGPGLAFTGVDADGYDRFYLCGPHQHKDQWWSGLKTAWKYKPGADNPIPEKLGAVSFDANADGVPDLYVACGSSEFPPGDPGLAHSLYLGDAAGAFVKAPAALCPEYRDAAGALAAGDFDGDGRVDLFVGGRLVPGAWPRTPVSHLLHNTPQGLVDIAPEIPGLQKPGMVTSALWADLDGDGLPELILALEWGPV